MTERWSTKRGWHATQRALPVREKVRIVVELQRRQAAINKVKAAAGRPIVPMRIWGEPR